MGDVDSHRAIVRPKQVVQFLADLAALSQSICLQGNGKHIDGELHHIADVNEYMIKWPY